MLLDDTQIQLTGRWAFHINPIAPNQFHSLHATNHSGDFASLNFTGTAIQVFGIVGPNNGNYSVRVDDTESQFSGFSDTQKESLLFAQQNLSDAKEHQLVVTNLLEGHLLTIDLLNITQPSSPFSLSSSPGISRGSIIAIALVAAFCFLILFGSLVYLFRRGRRRTMARERRERANESIAPQPRPLVLPSEQGPPMEERYPWLNDNEATPSSHLPRDSPNQLFEVV